MEHKLDMEFRAYCHDFNCHISYSLNDFERSKPEILAEILKTIEAQMNQHIQLKKIKMNKEANLTDC
jgi:hypothetical protein